MAGSKNNTHYSAGYNLLPVSPNETFIMQRESDGTQIVNVDGSPEGVVDANVGSLGLDRTNGNLYKKSSGTGNTGWEEISGSGNVVGPGLSTDNAVVRWDGTTGLLIQNSGVIINDANAVSGVTQLDVDNIRIDGNIISSTNTNGDINFSPNGTGRNLLNARLTIQDVNASGQQVTYRLYNTNNTASSGGTALYIAEIANGTLGGAAYASINDSTHSYLWGLDNNDSNNLRFMTQTGTSNPSFGAGTEMLSFTPAGAANFLGPVTIDIPLTVASGGTGVSSNTAYAVLCGGTTATGAVQSIASVGSSGQVLTSNGAGGYSIEASIRTTGAAATIVGIPDGDEDEDAAFVDVDWDVIASGNNIVVQVIGDTGLTINWRVLATYTFVS